MPCEQAPHALSIVNPPTQWTVPPNESLVYSPFSKYSTSVWGFVTAATEAANMHVSFMVQFIQGKCRET